MTTPLISSVTTAWHSICESLSTWRDDHEAVLIGPGIASFRDPATAAEPIEPSLAVIVDPAPLGPIPRSFRARPRFSTHDGHRVICIHSDAGTSLYGTGEVAGPLLRNGSAITLWTTDAFEYTQTNYPGLYQAHPWVLGVRPDGSAFGVLFDTTRKGTIQLAQSGSNISFRVQGPPLRIIVIERDAHQGGPAAVVSALSDLTGKTPLPPRWALGYHQSRWSYETQDIARSIAKDFRNNKIPCDVLWMDIDYMDGFRCFTFHPEHFPEPRRLNDDLHALGFKAVYMIDPGIKVDRGYRVYDSGRGGNHFVKRADGHEYSGEVWPGACAFPDFTSATARRWWADLYHDFMATGIDGVWNDMNEPAVFDQPGKYMPDTNLHRADPALGGPDTHARYRNVYGMLMVRASREGILRARPDRRPFVLTRSNFLGGHRYAATWTGDNKSDWIHLAWSIPMILNLGLSGQPFSGPDIGGFGGDADAALFARWMGIGSLLPFARGHSIKGSRPHEPWAFSDACTRTCRLALERRYKLLPFLYTLFHESSVNGLPVARPLFFADPVDVHLRDADDSFLLGSDLLVRCDVVPPPASVAAARAHAEALAASGQTAAPAVTEENPTAPHIVAPPGVPDTIPEKPGCRSPLPRGTWRPIELASEKDADLPQLLLRGGAILPTGPAMQFTGERPLDPLTLYIALDEAGVAQGALYEDAGDGHDHLAGTFLHTTYRAMNMGTRVDLTISSTQGSLPRPARTLRAILLMPDGSTRTATGPDGQPLSITL